MNYDKLVAALRYCSETPEEGKDCNLCDYYPKCSDVIAKEAADAIEELLIGTDNRDSIIDKFRDEILRLRKQMPKRGEWYTELFDGDKKYQCSNCLTHWDVKTRYCPFCGAKMEAQDVDLR